MIKKTHKMKTVQYMQNMKISELCSHLIEHNIERKSIHYDELRQFILQIIW